MKQINRILLLLGTLLLAGAVAVGLAACQKPVHDPIPEDTTTSVETTIPAETAEPTFAEQIGLDVKQADLKEIMQNIFDGTVSLKETVMFIDKSDVKSLLYPIESLVSVTSYDGRITYENKSGTKTLYL